mmetsp:Transcript_3966/g.9280  ORF Transcript_3966/g.9280 Transcript_3966/m.9280 type:complete len:237 (-) Transcript_3966:685-1395(-)
MPLAKGGGVFELCLSLGALGKCPALQTLTSPTVPRRTSMMPPTESPTATLRSQFKSQHCPATKRSRVTWQDLRIHPQETPDSSLSVLINERELFLAGTAGDPGEAPTLSWRPRRVRPRPVTLLHQSSSEAGVRSASRGNGEPRRPGDGEASEHLGRCGDRRGCGEQLEGCGERLERGGVRLGLRSILRDSRGVPVAMLLQRRIPVAILAQAARTSVPCAPAQSMCFDGVLNALSGR